MNGPPIKIIVDHREQNSVLDKLKELQADLEIKSLPVGDFILSEHVAIERKTVTDFLNSVIDGRIFEQASNLIQNFQKPLIIVEGHEDIYEQRAMHPQAIRGAICALSSDFRIPIIRTSSPEETAIFLHLLASREQIENNRKASLRGEKKPFEDKLYLEYLVSSLPGVGRGIAQNLLKQFKTIKNIINANEKELQTVEKIGKKKALRIKEIIEKEYSED